MRPIVLLGAILISANLCSAADKEPTPATVPDLIGQLSSTDFHVRQRAARQLGDLGLAARDAVPALGKLLHDVYPDVRNNAAKTLGQIGTPAVNVLVEALKDRDAGVRTRAAQALGQAGPDAKDAVPALIEALKDKQVEVRVVAVDALGEMGAEGKEAAPHLARLFHDPSVRLREHVRVALSSIGPAAVEPLCDVLGETKADGRVDAIRTISLFGPAAKKAVPALRHAMKDEDHRIRAAAAEALGKMEFDGADGVPELLNALNDKKLDVQREAVTALVLLTTAGVPDLLPKVREADRKMHWVVPVALAQVAAKPKNDLAGLMKDLRDKDPQVRTRAAFVFLELETQAQQLAMPTLLKMLEDEDPQLRLTAALLIARVERQKVERVRMAEKIMREALRPLMKIPPAVRGLQQRVAMTDPVVQGRARQIVMLYILETASQGASSIDHVLDQLGPEAVPAVVDGLNFVAANQIGTC